MMFIWRGKGIFVVLAVLIPSFVVSLFFDIFFGEHYYGNHPWAQVFSAAVAGVVCY